ncbi:MAG: hypothetical protein D6689_08790 [Deltaproteobacteria bacterium]|nr:MAG: hypothetical protein D6689_08790 [Deltaproteobacteria bacterium]
MNEACIDSLCQAAFGRIWTIIVVDGDMPSNNDSGEAWDAFGGAPDPFVEIQLNGSVLATTSEKQDTFSPAWNESVDANIPAGSSLVFRAWDSDVSSNDLMFTCTIDPLLAAYLDARAIDCPGGGGGRLRIHFSP